VATTRLSLYNGALLACGERELSALTDDTPSRRYLDQAWNSGAGFINEVLDEGQWSFARRTQRLDYDSNIDPQFGHPYAFAVPSDLVKTAGLCSDEFFNIPLLNYQIESGYFFASVTPIYISYVSNDSSYGGDLSRWPSNVSEYASLALALKIIPRLNGNKTDLDRLEKRAMRALRNAKSDDAMERPTAFAPTGSFVQARLRGRGSGRWDRGNRSSLIG
jgi:hypothetical protein